MLSFVYRGKEYTWDEWNNERKKFIEELELPDDFLLEPLIRELSPTWDTGYSIAIDKFRELYRLIASARYSLINSFNKFYDSNVIEVSADYKAHLWLRGEYLKNSIIWYNSCEDYIYQILWFAFDMGGKEITSSEEYEDQLKQVCYKIVKNKLEAKNTLESQALLLHINKYRFDKDVQYIRDKLANNLKHRGSLTFVGLEDARLMNFQKLDRNGSILFDSNWIEATIVDMDETIKLLKEVHKKLINFGRCIKDFISFEDMFEKDDNGVIIGNLIKDRKSYKKIVF